MAHRRLAALALSACGHHSAPPAADAPPFAGPSYVGPFTAQTCTAGTPGDPTCGINHLLLAATVAAAPSTLDFVAKPDATQLVITNVQIDVGADGLYLADAYMQEAPCTPPVPPAENWGVIDVQSGPVVLADFDVTVIPGTAQICIEYQSLGGFDP
ncbi:MAG TPA: hypothetical protein VMJ10_03285 [Kofleriaceae bacterium]|nr:hypothetical protein [Kofleriaceae bacterium]